MTDVSAARVPHPRGPKAEHDHPVAAFHAVWRDFVAASRGGSYEVTAGIARARTQLPAPSFNGVWALDRRVDVAALMAASDEFAAADLPWNLQLRPGYPSEVDDLLAARGLVVTGDIPLMQLTDPSQLEAAAAVPGLAVRPAYTYNDIDSALTLLERGFEMPHELVRDLLSLRALLLPESATWIGAVGGEDVTTALAAVRLGVSGVFNVATPAEHRGRGYGAAITAHAVLQDLAGGARSAVLQSSAMGFRVYERIGFETIETWRQWMPTTYAEH